jgi:hypothetical protein
LGLKTPGFVASPSKYIRRHEMPHYSYLVYS